MTCCKSRSFTPSSTSKMTNSWRSNRSIGISQSRRLWRKIRAAPSRLSYLAGADDLVFRRSQFCESKGSPAVQFLRADSHFGAETEFPAVGESRGGIPVDCGGIY